MAQWVKNPPAMQETKEMQVLYLAWEDPLGEELATHSSIIAWKIQWTDEPGGLQCKVIFGHDWVSYSRKT